MQVLCHCILVDAMMLAAIAEWFAHSLAEALGTFKYSPQVLNWKM